MPGGCSAHSDEWIFQVSIRLEMTAETTSRRNCLTVQKLPPLVYSTDTRTDKLSESDSESESDDRSRLVEDVINGQQKSFDKALNRDTITIGLR